MGVRDLRWADFDALVETYWALYDERERGEPYGIPLFAERPSREAEAAWFANLYRGALTGDRIVVVADDAGRAVGMCEVRPIGPGDRNAENGHMGELGILVARSHRGRGLGRALIVRALELAPSRFESVRLWVHETNTGARRLYADLGFVSCGLLPRAVRRDGVYVAVELMWRDLAGGAPPETPTKR
jgi:ribosomal protein S18 acetylase RimI-like enzyme